MDVDSRLELLLRPPTDEVITVEELRGLLEGEDKPKHYIGFEISGPLHLGSLFVAGYKIRDFIEAGFRTTIFLADWHSYINDKLGGDRERIREAARYYGEIFKWFAPGVDVVLGSDLYSRTPEYWELFIRLAKKTTISRVARTLTIMGRRAKENLDAAQYAYPLMQTADMKALEVDVAHAGIDQRKVHMLARDVFPKLGWDKPIALHHHLLTGLQEPRGEGLDEDPNMDVKVSSKMSKSKPESAIFIHDSEDIVEKKILKAWCPQGVTENNPILELVKYIVFREKDYFLVERASKYGGDIIYSTYDDLERDFRGGRLHPLDLKRSTAREINDLLDSARKRLSAIDRYLEILGT